LDQHQPLRFQFLRRLLSIAASQRTDEERGLKRLPAGNGAFQKASLLVALRQHGFDLEQRSGVGFQPSDEQGAVTVAKVEAALSIFTNSADKFRGSFEKLRVLVDVADYLMGLTAARDGFSVFAPPPPPPPVCIIPNDFMVMDDRQFSFDRLDERIPEDVALPDFLSIFVEKAGRLQPNQIRSLHISQRK
jgi:hypothetical protein